MNLLDTPLTLSFDLGSEPKLSPYIHFAGGLSFDSDAIGTNRLSLLAVSENYNLSNRAGLSWSMSRNEIRLEGRLRDQVPEWNISVIF